jgi:putative nucleotidyltransferase with HDIG domain
MKYQAGGENMARADNDLIVKIEEYVKEAFHEVEGAWYLVAHDFKHVDRVRNWAVYLAEKEEFGDLQLVEATALLHDIGLAYKTNGVESSEATGTKTAKLPEHATTGARMAEKYLRENTDYTGEKIQRIALAIGYHSTPPWEVDDFVKTIPEDSAMLIKILRDADTLDAVGAVGLMRAFTSKYFMPEYAPGIFKGESWGLTDEEFHARFGPGLGSVKYIIDQINQQIRYYENFRTGTAKQIAGPLVQYMRDFVLQLDSEINYAAR